MLSKSNHWSGGEVEWKLESGGQLQASHAGNYKFSMHLFLKKEKWACLILTREKKKCAKR